MKPPSKEVELRVWAEEQTLAFDFAVAVMDARDAGLVVRTAHVELSGIPKRPWVCSMFSERITLAHAAVNTGGPRG